MIDKILLCFHTSPHDACTFLNRYSFAIMSPFPAGCSTFHIKQEERLYLSFPFGRESQITFKG